MGMNKTTYDRKTGPHTEFHGMAGVNLGNGTYRVLPPDEADQPMPPAGTKPRVRAENRAPYPAPGCQPGFSERYRELYDSAPMACLSLDQHGRIMEANLSSAHMFGMRQEHLINLPLVNFLDWADRPAFSEFLKSIAPGARRRIETRLLFGSRPDTWVRIEGARGAYQQGRDTPLHLALMDITEHKRQAQRLIEEARILGTAHFAANIAHVLNNRMATVLGYAELLKTEHNLDDHGRKMVSSIAQAAQTVGDLSDLIVAYACPGSSGEAVASLNDTIMALLRREQKDPRIHTIQDIEPELWDIRIDPHRLRMIVANLYANAREAIASQGRIKITARNLEKKTSDQPYLQGVANGAYVRLTIQDTGCGIPPEDLGRIFEPFYSTKFMGRGMGLAAVQGIVRGCGGHIEVTSAPCCTSFSVYLPAVKKPRRNQAARSVCPDLKR